MVIVGAGCAGLACARVLFEAGEQPVVLDKARGVGGRAATRRVDGQPIDHGVIFFHGSDPDFLEALDRVDSGTRLDGWPATWVGEGQPCLPRAFAPGERRLAFTQGITAFPKFLARELDVRLRTDVRSLVVREHDFELHINDGETMATDALVLALPAAQMRSFIEPLPAFTALDSARALLQTLSTDPCLTLIATYPPTTPVPDWDVMYPDDSDIVMLASHDSRKRPEKKFHAFVLQCSARFSRRHLDDEPSSWVETVLNETGRLVGGWAQRPLLAQAHRWRYGRANSFPLSGPLLVDFPGGQTLGLTGEIFNPALGVEAAYLSGKALAHRILRTRGN